MPEMESKPGTQGDGTAPAGVDSPGTYVPVSQTPCPAADTLPK